MKNLNYWRSFSIVFACIVLVFGGCKSTEPDPVEVDLDVPSSPSEIDDFPTSVSSGGGGGTVSISNFGSASSDQTAAQTLSTGVMTELMDMVSDITTGSITSPSMLSGSRAAQTTNIDTILDSTYLSNSTGATLSGFIKGYVTVDDVSYAYDADVKEKMRLVFASYRPAGTNYVITGVYTVDVTVQISYPPVKFAVNGEYYFGLNAVDINSGKGLKLVATIKSTVNSSNSTSTYLYTVKAYRNDGTLITETSYSS
jgi:hypothetical protein